MATSTRPILGSGGVSRLQIIRAVGIAFALMVLASSVTIGYLAVENLAVLGGV